MRKKENISFYCLSPGKGPLSTVPRDTDIVQEHALHNRSEIENKSMWFLFYFLNLHNFKPFLICVRNGSGITRKWPQNAKNFVMVKSFTYAGGHIAISNQAAKHTLYGLHWVFSPNTQRSCFSLWMVTAWPHTLTRLANTTFEKIKPWACNVISRRAQP